MYPLFDDLFFKAWLQVLCWLLGVRTVAGAAPMTASSRVHLPGLRLLPRGALADLSFVSTGVDSWLSLTFFWEFLPPPHFFLSNHTF